MITATQRTELKTLIGSHYTNAIIRELKLQNVYNNRNKPFTMHSILAIVNGQRTNYTVEKVIFKMIDDVKERIAKLEAN